ncbi:hypothetical protein [uncultured Brachyspira sp.]|uniref:hypothetical protein n=1 Tax=uncultured Brachyspira sp. TaxID=221953 RepID=UPI0024317349|nr:hypothetical protein [uncultured Brachyspira sp.]
MSLLKDIFGKKRKKLTCSICGNKIENDFKTTYLNIDGCLQLSTVHYECAKKLNNLEKSIKGE